MRIPVIFEQPGRAADVFLVEGDARPPAGAYAAHFIMPRFQGHVAGCACCAPRGPAAAALAQMFRARATGAAPFFTRVVVLASAAGKAAIKDAIANDVVSAARYRMSYSCLSSR